MSGLRGAHAAIRVSGELTMGVEFELDASGAKALRFREVNPREAFTVGDAAGSYFRASLVELGAQRARAVVYERMATSPEPRAELTLVCAVLARQRMIQVAQKATELGVTRLVPVFTAHSGGPAGLEHEKAHAWPGQVVRAARQCRRASVPEVRAALPLERLLDDALWQGAALRVALDDRATPGPTLREAVTGARGRAVALAVGPEGGWSDAERELLRARGALAMRLGGRVLRAETAVFAGLTVLQHLLGELGDDTP